MVHFQPTQQTHRQLIMERWANKVALVTGAGSGIGSQMARELCAHKVIVYGLDFKKEPLEKVGKGIVGEYPSAIFSSILCDLTKEEEIQAAFARIIAERGGVDILVNCAGILTNASMLDEGSDAGITRVIQTNLLAVISCTKKAYKSMADRDVDGHIVNMCSVAGQTMLSLSGKPTLGPYSISKYGVKVLNRAIGQELAFFKKSKIRISNISPGFVAETAILDEATDLNKAMNQEGSPRLVPKDISDTLIFILSAPRHVQVREVIIEGVGGTMW